METVAIKSATDSYTQITTKSETALKQPANQLEDWLAILTQTYSDHPSQSLAKVIDYYINRILQDSDITCDGDKQCQYYAMRKYWHWQSQQH
ncbi:hypothetical protein J7384_06810 [Endozoicomonas sp. G2_1]|uniref:hypothetical protein n=1 Tax=Endozoicomonas sp. G2_1 TaxID=2821091 RepID=UPI001ADB5A33|nr:hypothetical protein [Endozoicomonas sp. G2_1]MBO9490065.1 hypothetical protein [Endozoicomonas sp. G2_1]